LKNLFFYLFLVSLFCDVALGWGTTGHRYINRKAVVHLPETMPQFIAQQAFFEAHAMDADYRRSTDTAEAPKHYIDIDNYPNFHNITRNLDSLIMQYGWPFVRENGIVPWATVWTLDSLTAQLARGDWAIAYLTASDMGHYVADAHQPLHCTRNYNGQYTGNYGIHSRYESTMITTFQDSLYIVQDSIFYIEDPINFIFEYVFHSQSLADSVMQADNYAKAMSGWNGSGTPPSSYYAYLWQRSRVYTIDQIQRATVVLASFWYTAWVDAGLLPNPTSVGESHSTTVNDYFLEQNFPNPFNPSTIIRYRLPGTGFASLKVYDALGREVATLVNKTQQSGVYEVVFDASGLSSGIYIYRLSVRPPSGERTGVFQQTKKLLIIQ
jgi:hypothetical protein